MKVKRTERGLDGVEVEREVRRWGGAARYTCRKVRGSNLGLNISAFFRYVVHCLLLGILVAEDTQSLVTTLQSLGGLGHDDIGHYSIVSGQYFSQ